MIKKEHFINIMDRLKCTRDTQEKIDKIIQESKDFMITDFTYAASLMICHEDIVIELLEKIFDDTEDIISYWIYELKFGTTYKDGCVSELDGTIIDISTADKLYDYLVKEMGENK